MKILIIDDNEDDRLLYRRTLQKNLSVHYSFMEASDGDEGLKLIRTGEPSCVLLDYSLPGSNGVEVLKRIRSQYPFIPVIMLTGQGNENVAVEAMREGAQNYISKSTISTEALLHAMRMGIEHCAMQKRIQEQRTSLEVFTRALAHDLNEPVRTIRSFIELIGQFDSFPEKAKGYFHYIQTAADRMHMLINTVYLYTRLDDPGQMLRENCAMDAALKEAEENLSQLIGERQAKITSDPLPEIYASRTQFMQVLQNLIGNAVNHSEKPVAVHVKAVEQSDHWLFSVADNGPGIEERFLLKIFEPFKRMVRHEEQGAGLGLAICKKIVESHGGKIWCESAPGKGATFYFTVPKAVPEEAQAPLPAAQAVSPKSPAPGSEKQLANILLVDDSKAFIEITQFELIETSKLKCNLFIAHGGEEALERLQDKTPAEGPIDLVLLDINMPEMDGFEVLERMHAQSALRDIPVVMCTGSIYDKDMQRAKSLGAIGYLTKPVEFSKLAEVLDNARSIQLQPENSGYSLVRAA